MTDFSKETDCLEWITEEIAKENAAITDAVSAIRAATLRLEALNSTLTRRQVELLRREKEAITQLQEMKR